MDAAFGLFGAAVRQQWEQAMTGKLWKNGEFMTDVWREIADDEVLPTKGYAILNRNRWLGERDQLRF